MFHILRYFSITSFIVIAAAAVATISLVLFYRQITVTELIEIGESRNVALTQAFKNSIWPRFATYVTTVADDDGDQLRANPETAQIHEAVVMLIKDLPVIRVKIYNLEGTVIFSTDPREIGGKKHVPGHRNEGAFEVARSGRIVSKVSHHDEVNAFGRILRDRNVLESYLPVRQGDGPVEAVFELFSDVTALIQRVDEIQRDILLGLVAAFGLIYGGLFLVVLRGDTILKKQYGDIVRAQENVRAKNQELNSEIVERKQAQAAILENEQRIRSIMENVADGLVTFDEAGIIETVNPSVELLFGYSAEQLMGENISILMPKSGDDDGQAKIFDIGPQEATWRRKDGSTFEIELAVSEVSLGEKQIFIGTIRDATARKKAHTILRAAKQEAEQANFAKSKFFCRGEPRSAAASSRHVAVSAAAVETDHHR